MSLDFKTDNKSIEPDHLWSKEDILRNVTQEEIFEYYLNIPVEYNTYFCSPLRTDKNPTCSFKKMPSGKLLYRDWAEPRSKDCFDVVQEMFGVNFGTALQIVARDMGLTDKAPEGNREYNKDKVLDNKPVHSEKSVIKVKTQSFTYVDEEYFESYYITKKILNAYNVYSVKAAYVNDKNVYLYNKQNPAVAYYFGKDDKGNQKWKIYHYKNNGKFKFIGNTNRINGWIQIPETGRDLVITKSMKDVMCLARFSIPSIAMQAETQIPYDYIIEELEERYKNIYTLLDFDRTGIISANKIKRLYDIPPLFLTDGSYGSIDFGYKDFSDFLQGNGMEQTEELIGFAENQLRGSYDLFPNL